jgi:hypothetical protein
MEIRDTAAISVRRILKTAVWSDGLIALLFAVGTTLACALMYSAIEESASTWDVWFGADSPRVVANMTQRESDHYRTKVHPLFSLATAPVVHVLKIVTRAEGRDAMWWVVWATAGAWGAGIFLLFRFMACARLDAMLFSAVAMTSASAVFCLPVPETYASGSLTIVIALCVVAIAQRARVSETWFTAMSALTLSMTTTNWMVGLVATKAHHSWPRTLQISANAFAIVVLLWAVQKYVFPSAQFFLGDREETNYAYLPTLDRLREVLAAFFWHSMVMPEIASLGAHEVTGAGRAVLSIQDSLPGSAGAVGFTGVVLWTALLVIGLASLLRFNMQRELRLVVGWSILGQLALHTIYGEETFLYSLHFAPLLMVVAAFGTFTRARPLVLGLACALLVANLWNNGTQFAEAALLLGWR